MRIAKITADGDEWRAVFEDGVNSVEKIVKVTSTAEPSGSKYVDVVCVEVARGLLKAMRQAERDLAFLKYGIDWTSHVPWGGFFDPPTDEEKRMIEDALHAQ